MRIFLILLALLVLIANCPSSEWGFTMSARNKYINKENVACVKGICFRKCNNTSDLWCITRQNGCRKKIDCDPQYECFRLVCADNEDSGEFKLD